MTLRLIKVSWWEGYIQRTSLCGKISITRNIVPDRVTPKTFTTKKGQQKIANIGTIQSGSFTSHRYIYLHDDSTFDHKLKEIVSSITISQEEAITSLKEKLSILESQSIEIIEKE